MKRTSPDGGRVTRLTMDFGKDTRRPGQPGESCPKQNGNFPLIPKDRIGVRGFKDHIGTDRRRLMVLRECAANLRRTRGAWASADGNHYSASDQRGRTTSERARRSRPATSISHHSDHLVR